jgi:hypothetical protein
MKQSAGRYERHDDFKTSTITKSLSECMRATFMPYSFFYIISAFSAFKVKGSYRNVGGWLPFFGGFDFSFILSFDGNKPKFEETRSRLPRTRYNSCTTQKANSKHSAQQWFTK